MDNEGLRFGITMKIAVTKLKEKSEGIFELFLAQGHDVILAPTMRAEEPVDDSALIELVRMTEEGSIDILIFTSSLGADKFLTRCKNIPSSTSIISVGPKTQEKVEEYGYQSEMPDAFNADNISTYLSGKVNGKHVGIARADVPNPELIESLEKLGASVYEATAYVLVPAPGDFKNAIKSADAVIFTSAKSFKLADVVCRDLEGITTIAIGPKTSEFMASAGVMPDVVGDGTLKGCLEILNSDFDDA